MPDAEITVRYPEVWSPDERRAVDDALGETGLPYRFGFPGAEFTLGGFWIDLIVKVAIAGGGGLAGRIAWEAMVALFGKLRRQFSHGQLVVEALDRPITTYVFPQAADDWTTAAAAIPDDYEHFSEGEVKIGRAHV